MCCTIGCTAWVPSIYTFHTGWLLARSLIPGSSGHEEVLLTWKAFWVLWLCGVLCIYVNYAADVQKSYVRGCNGKCNVWGAPAKVIRAEYVDDKGRKKRSLLLYSGFWGISRHFHYIPEILGALFWTVPVHYSSILPYFYVIYLIILLFDRAGRDDERCRNKYGKYWDKYCKYVPYKVVPFLF